YQFLYHFLTTIYHFREAIQNSLAKRNLSFSQVLITDDNFISVHDGSIPYSSNSAIDEHTDLDHLAGKVLKITEKDGSKKVLQKAASFGSRSRPPVLSSSASTEETTEIEQHKLTSKQKQRFSSFFGAKSSQQEQVCAQLNEYSRTGIPEKSSRDFFNNPDHKEAMAYLDTIEGSWKDFVNCEGMSNNEIKIQTAIWELVTT
uniref:Uncharacterized protein n=1 Tax=Megaselia scalaris TaxID=36166 RepID=T1H4V0_MEGSC